MMEMAARLHGVNQNQAITAIKTLRNISGGSLRWAKMDVYDKVRSGHSISVPVPDMQAIEDLQGAGWTASVDEAAVVEFSARVPAAQVENLEAIVRALGGSVGC